MLGALWSVVSHPATTQIAAKTAIAFGSMAATQIALGAADKTVSRNIERAIASKREVASTVEVFNLDTLLAAKQSIQASLEKVAALSEDPEIYRPTLQRVEQEISELKGERKAAEIQPSTVVQTTSEARAIVTDVVSATKKTARPANLAKMVVPALAMATWAVPIGLGPVGLTTFGAIRVYVQVASNIQLGYLLASELRARRLKRARTKKIQTALHPAEPTRQILPIPLDNDLTTDLLMEDLVTFPIADFSGVNLPISKISKIGSAWASAVSIKGRGFTKEKVVAMLEISHQMGSFTRPLTTKEVEAFADGAFGYFFMAAQDKAA